MLEQSPLGKSVSYSSYYDPSLLFAIPRATARKGLEIAFHGADLWTGYELSWLNNKGKPQAAILELIIPADSTHIIESKSLKLYLNSLNQTRVESKQALEALLVADLSRTIGKDVALRVILPTDFSQLKLEGLDGFLLDDLDLEVNDYKVNPDFLKTTSGPSSEKLVSHLLRSNCPVTGQPDFASIQIHYRGKTIEREGLLKYLISFREHEEFHEHCIERIFLDILKKCEPECLTVFGRFTRRGGLEINPFRSNFEPVPQNIRDFRQ